MRNTLSRDELRKLKAWAKALNAHPGVEIELLIEEVLWRRGLTLRMLRASDRRSTRKTSGYSPKVWETYVKYGNMHGPAMLGMDRATFMYRSGQINAKEMRKRKSKRAEAVADWLDALPDAPRKG